MSAIGVSRSVLADVPLLAGADEVSLAALAAEAEPLRVLAGDWALREQRHVGEHGPRDTDRAHRPTHPIGRSYAVSRPMNTHLR